MAMPGLRGEGAGSAFLGELFTNVKKGIEEENDGPNALMEYLLPFLKTYGITNKSATRTDVRENDIKELAHRWNVKIKDPKTKKPFTQQQLLERLVAHVEGQMSGVPTGGGKKNDGGLLSLSASADSMRAIMGKKKKKVPNYFGLPNHAYASSPHALVYMARKPTREAEQEDPHDHLEEHHHHEHHHHVHHDHENKAVSAHAGAGVAQRKVAEALFMMSKNDLMSKHFIHSGGVEAVVRLITESSDSDVLNTCAQCFLQVTEGRSDYCRALTEKHILSNLQTLIEKGDADIRLTVAQVVTNMTYHESLCDLLVLGGVMGMAQLILGLCESVDCTQFVMLIINNIAPTLAPPDTEVAVRVIMTCTKRLDIMHFYDKASFVLDIFTNFTRMMQYSTLLCEEGLLPLILHLFELYPTVEVVGCISECFVNLSLTRKNRREISTCGIGNQLDKIFNIGTPPQRAHALLMVGNLLSSGYFHDKIARDDTINTMLDNMLDPAQPKQFTAVAYCISQLAQVATSATVMVRCEVVRIVLALLRQAPPDAYTYLWTLLVAISQQPVFFEKMVPERALIQEMYKEAMLETSKDIELVTQLAYNLALHSNFSSFLSQDLIELFVELHKELFSKHGLSIRQTCLTTLINFCSRTKSSRVVLLGHDLITMFEDAGIDNAVMNVKYVALVNIVSNEENLIIKLLDAGAQKFIVSLQGSIAAMSISKDGSKIDGELGRAITAATFHNLSLKRAVMGPGMLSNLMSLIRNCKTIRILHIVRCMANITVHPKAKILIAKEKRLISALTATMRSGCEEADRVQHYCALVICNVLALQVDKAIMEELAKSGAITDLVVCTLLRINSVFTKESLTKALFNLLSRADFRREMVLKLDVLAAMIELAKIENVEILELCMRSVYNITCETANFSEKIAELKLPNILVARVTSSPNIPGAKPTTAIKMFCGMALANISFDRNLASDLAFDKKISDAAFCVFQLVSDEATYCAAVLLLNISLLPDAKNLADSKAVPLLVSIMNRGPVACTQMAVAALCNFSMIQVYYDQITACAVGPMIEILGLPTLHSKIKMDALQFLYNMVTLHQPSRVVAVEQDAVVSLWKVLKAQSASSDEYEGTLYRIARIVKDMSSEAVADAVQKKLLTDGVMGILLKLSKIELPALKLDCACTIYNMTQASDTLKVLQWDGMDVLFWLTLHDCLNMYDPIRKNVARALRNFSAVGAGQGAVVLAKEERCLAVLRSLAKSTSEDVQWQAAGSLYNLLSVPEAQELLLQRGVVALLQELANQGHEAVQHVCSACLHLCPPDAMPDLSDPAALQLVLCLLEADADRFAELSELASDPLPYILGNTNASSEYRPDPSTFVATWVSISCEVDSLFTPALVDVPQGQYMTLAARPSGSGDKQQSEKPKKVNGGTYDHFGLRRRKTGASASTAGDDDGDGDDDGGDVDRSEGGDDAGRGGARGRTRTLSSSDPNPALTISISTPAPLSQPPPSAAGGGMSALGSGTGGSDDAYHSPVEPEQASSIAFPKIYNKQSMPQDTVLAINKHRAGTGTKTKTKTRGSSSGFGSTGTGSLVDSNTLPPRLQDESISVNRHGNSSLRR